MWQIAALCRYGWQRHTLADSRRKVGEDHLIAFELDQVVAVNHEFARNETLSIAFYQNYRLVPIVVTPQYGER